MLYMYVYPNRRNPSAEMAQKCTKTLGWPENQLIWFIALGVAGVMDIVYARLLISCVNESELIDSRHDSRAQEKYHWVDICMYVAWRRQIQ